MPQLTDVKLVDYDEDAWVGEARRDRAEDPGHHPQHALTLNRARRVTAITIDGVARSFGTVRAVDDVSIAVRDGEFFTLLGPSGCGKTTLLRMVAGFCELDARPHPVRRAAHRHAAAAQAQHRHGVPELRGVSQSHGRRQRRLRAARTQSARATRSRERVARALKLVQLDGYAERWPHQLSGGQLQRVAIARAIVIEPHVLLLDEPLSNLDAKLRVEMRGEIRRLQKLLGITVLYVTHDQEEALAISDRIAVMRAGRVEQIADAARDLRAAGDAVRRELRRHHQSARGRRARPRRRHDRGHVRRRRACGCAARRRAGRQGRAVAAARRRCACWAQASRCRPAGRRSPARSARSSISAPVTRFTVRARRRNAAAPDGARAAGSAGHVTVAYDPAARRRVAAP